MRLFGVPMLVWAGLCLVVAVVWMVVWPSDRVAATDGLRFVILRWFHALTWLLLALAAAIAGLNIAGGPATARIVGWAALLVYVVFMVAFVTSRS